MSSFSFNTIYKLSPGAVYKVNGEEVTIVLLDDDDNYFKIDELAAKVFTDFAEGDQSTPIGDLYNSFKGNYDLPEEEFKKDFEGLFNTLIELKVIEV